MFDSIFITLQSSKFSYIFFSNLLLVFSLAGNYWLDPDLGSIENAILAHCDFQQNRTCVNTTTVHSKTLRYQGDKGYVWIGEEILKEKVSTSSD